MKALIIFLTCNAVLFSNLDVHAQSSTTTKQLAEANNAFAIDMYRELAAQEKGNIVYSPASLDIGLAMTYAAAGGENAKEIAHVMRLENGNTNLDSSFSTFIDLLNDTNSLGNSFIMANSLWAQERYPFLKPYQQRIRDSYRAAFTVIDFNDWPDFRPNITEAKLIASRKTINEWIEQKTQGKFKEALPKNLPDKGTRMMLLDTVYFKGAWDFPFDKRQTAVNPFYVDQATMVSIPTMHKTTTLKYASDDDVQLIELPYVSNVFSMVILLPVKQDGLAKVEKDLTLSQIEELLKHSNRGRIHLSMPSFRNASLFRLDKQFKDLGMVEAFKIKMANFPMITSGDFGIEAIIHRARIDVDEQGTEAAGATVMAFTDSTGGGALDFNMNHPFLYFIRHNPSGAFVFMGRVTNPAVE